MVNLAVMMRTEGRVQCWVETSRKVGDFRIEKEQTLTNPDGETIQMMYKVDEVCEN